MKKRLVILWTLMALFLPQTVWAETVKCLVLTEANGTVNKFALADAPVVTFSEGDLVVACGSQTLTVSLEGLTLTYGEMESTRIDEVAGRADATDRPVFSFDEARIEGLRPGAAVSVYSLDGKCIDTVKAGDDGRVSVALGHLPKGVYILRTPTRSFKIKH